MICGGSPLKGGNTWSLLVTILDPKKPSLCCVSRKICSWPSDLFTFAPWVWGRCSAALQRDVLGEAKCYWFQWRWMFQHDHRKFAMCRIAPWHPLCLSSDLHPWAFNRAFSPLPTKAASSQASTLHRKGCHCPSVASLPIPKATPFLDWLHRMPVARCTLFFQPLTFLESGFI